MAKITPTLAVTIDEFRFELSAQVFAHLRSVRTKDKEGPLGDFVESDLYQSSKYYLADLKREQHDVEYQDVKNYLENTYKLATELLDHLEGQGEAAKFHSVDVQEAAHDKMLDVLIDEYNFSPGNPSLPDTDVLWIKTAARKALDQIAAESGKGGAPKQSEGFRLFVRSLGKVYKKETGRKPSGATTGGPFVRFTIEVLNCLPAIAWPVDKNGAELTEAAIGAAFGSIVSPRKSRKTST